MKEKKLKSKSSKPKTEEKLKKPKAIKATPAEEMLMEITDDAGSDEVVIIEEEVSTSKPVKKPKKLNELAEKKILNTTNLPDHIANRRIVGKSTVMTNKIDLKLADITGTSRQMYLNDIHSGLPVVLEEHYWVNMRGQRWPLARVDKDDYDFVMAHATHLKESDHRAMFIDAAVNPTLTYSWRVSELNSEGLPTLDMVELQDAKHKKNPTYVHNSKVNVIITEREQGLADPLPPDNEDEEEDVIFADD